MTNKIPVTIITGFLGSGKTTLINQLLKQTGEEKIAVIINEFGDIGVDHHLVLNVKEDIYQMNNGCLCCTLRTDLAEMLHAILTVKQRNGLAVDRIIIETTGLAEPSPIAQTFMRTPFLQESFYLDSVLTVVDAGNCLYQISHYAEAAEQIAFADKLFISKATAVESYLLERIQQKIKQLNPLADIQQLNLDQIKTADILDLKLFSALDKNFETFSRKVKEQHDHDHDHSSHDHDHIDENGISSISIVEDKPLDIDILNEWMNELVFTFGMDLLRYKGILYLKGLEKKMIFQGVNMAFAVEYGEPWETDDRRSSFVMIGKDLPAKAIRESFKECTYKNA